MRTEIGTTVHRQDYQPFPFEIPQVELEFDLDPDLTWLHARLTVRRKAQATGIRHLELDGEDLALVSVHVNGVALVEGQYTVSPSRLILHDVPDESLVEIVSTSRPIKNTSLSGLYVSGTTLFTQCEAQGFRRICWFADRPDVMSTYRVTLRADRRRFPVLLSNGNLVRHGDLGDGNHEAVWHDPFAKPCYLFALVAGALACREHRMATRSGREVLLQVYSDPGSESQTAWAMESLERSVRWDEQRFGLELDLDRFMIVAARDFNMGAMENKGLNIFNAAYVLADPATATDANYQAIEAVIGHEYFHNWTGNRVTCRDWFQLSLKEGLTVFRDQEFTADMMASDLPAHAAASARAVKRIDDVVALRAAQFPEDSGPMAHPIRPESYQEIGNFYTATVYEKGAEVIRMLHTLLGEECFRAGMDEYFRRHDGQAVTCDDFVASMEWAFQQRYPARDLQVFRRWYGQAGTPRVDVALDYDATTHRCRLTLTQSCPPVGVEKQADVQKQPLHIPVAVGLLDAAGVPIALHQHGEPALTALLELTEASQTWEFDDVPSAPTPSLLRDFSAPVIVKYPYSDGDLALLSAHDGNAFARWEAGQQLATREILAIAARWRETGHAGDVSPVMVRAWSALLADPSLDAGYRARALTLPGEKTVLERMLPMDAVAVAQARQALRRSLGEACAAAWDQACSSNATPGPYSPAPAPAGRRALKNLALSFLLAAGQPGAAEAALVQFNHATNMTDRLAALTGLAHYTHLPETAAAIMRFFEDWQHDPLVVDKWFALQATSPFTTVSTMHGLMAHPAFTLRNPNRARALVFQFCLMNPTGFHAPDGSGYAFWADQTLALDAINPEIAARLARALDPWSRFVPQARALMQAQLQRVASHPGLSRNTLEIVTKALSL